MKPVIVEPVNVETVKARLSFLEDLNARGVGTALRFQQFEIACLRELLALLESRTVTVTVPYSSEAELVADRCNRHRAAKLRSGNATSEATGIKVEAE